MNLSKEEVEIIRRQVEESQLSIITLKDDLVDHLCSATERKIEAGEPFETALKEALRELAPEGLIELERETIFLINNSIDNPMKKAMFLIGCLCSMAISLGWLLKFLNIVLPVAHMLFGLGSFGFMLFFLPMLAVTHFRTTEKPFAEKLRFIFGISSIVIIGIAILARLMRLPGADEVMVVGLAISTFGFLPFFYFTLYKKSLPGP